MLCKATSVVFNNWREALVLFRFLFSFFFVMGKWFYKLQIVSGPEMYLDIDGTCTLENFIRYVPGSFVFFSICEWVQPFSVVWNPRITSCTIPVSLAWWKMVEKLYRLDHTSNFYDKTLKKVFNLWNPLCEFPTVSPLPFSKSFFLCLISSPSFPFTTRHFSPLTFSLSVFSIALSFSFLSIE